MTELSVTEGSSSFVSSLHILLRSYWNLYERFFMCFFPQRICIEDNPFWFALVCFYAFWFALVYIIYTWIRGLLHTRLRVTYLWCASHLRSFKDNVQIDYHCTNINLYFWIKVTVSRLMFVTTPHITLIRQLLRFLNNIINILQTDISNVIPCIFLFPWPSNGLDTQRGNKTLSWYPQTIFWFWRCDFHFV